MTVDSKAFRHALGQFATGVSVVSGLMPDGTPAGLTVSTLASVSLDPPLVSFCIARATASLDAFVQGETFAVSILGEDQKAVSDLFASRPDDKFDDVTWKAGDNGCAIVSGSLASLECSRVALHEVGDHVLIIGQVDRVDAAGEGNPLLYFRGGYGRFGGAS